MPPTERPAPGTSTLVPLAPGVQRYNELRAAGFSEGEANQWAVTRTKELESAGFKPSEVADYWGNGNPQSAALAGHVSGNINTYARDNAKLASSPMEAFAAGWDLSVSGLVKNQAAPGTVLPEDASTLDRVMHGVGMFVGDLPATVTGFVAGGAAGGAAGSAVAPGPGTAVGGVAGAGFGAAALPEGARQVLLDSYALRDGKIRTWNDAVQVAGHSLIETTKQGVIGVVTAPIGGAAGGAAIRAGAAPIVAGGVNATTQAITATAMGGAMNGHVPDARDFEAAAILALGFHTAGAVASRAKITRVQANLETLYRQTGTTPWEAVNRAKEDPAFRSELTTQDVNGDPVARNFRASAQPDPEPFKRGQVIEGDFEVLDRGRTTGAKKPAPSKPAERPAATRALPGTGALYVNDVPTAMAVLRKLEGSADDAVSPAGAIGRYQIMPGTARQYMGDNFDVKTLFDPVVNERVASAIAADLYKRYSGNMNAIAIAYNAGPGRAGQYMAKGEGTRLRAVPDKTMRGGLRYESEHAPRDESFLPKETQKYLANLRRRFEGALPEADEAAPEQRAYPSYDLTAEQGGGAGGGEPPGGEGGGGQRRIEGPQEQPDFWSRANEESLTEEMLRNIGEQPSPSKIVDPDHILSQFVSELTPARRIDDRLIREGEMDRTRDLGAEDMFRQTYASDSRAGVFVRYGAIDPITLEIKPGSKSMMDAASAVKEDGGNLDGWVAYMLAKRTVEKEDQGIKTGFNPKAARALAENKKAAAKYQRATDIFQEVTNSALDYSRESGVYSQAQVDAMIRDNATYISMRRIMGDDETFARSGRGFRPRDSLKKMEGSDRQIIDPIMASLDNIRLMIKMADRNRAIGHIVGMAERGELKGLDVRKIEDQQTIKAADEKVFKPYGLPPEEAAATYGPLLAEKQSRAWAKTSPNDFLFFRDGKAERWTTGDPQLAELLRKADSPGQANLVISTFQTFARVQRAGIVAAPDFPLRNTLRDQITAFVVDPLHPPPFVTWLSGIAHVLKQDAVFQDAVAKGALGSALVDMDTNWLAKDMDAIFTSTNTWEAVANSFKHPIEFMQIVSERIDAASRVGYFKHAQAKGVEGIKAATMSRKAYLDFAERGTAQVADTMAKVIPFFRPSLLGLKQFGEAMRERPGSTLAYAAATIAMPMVALYILNYLQDQFLPDGEKYADLPRWQRDHYFITPDIAGTRFRLRLPQQVGFVFGGMTNRMLDAFVQKDKHAFEEWGKGFLADYLPPMWPSLVQTPVEVMTNHNFFTGRSLIPSTLEKNTGYMQYTPATSETGKAIARFLGEPGLDVAEFSPIQFDHFIQGWTGTVGSTILKALDLPFQKVEKPWEVADIPFVGSFVTRTPGMSSEPIQQFYAGMAELEKKSNDFALAMRRAEGGNLGEIELTAEASQYAQAVAPIKAAIQVQAAAIQGINSNPEMTADEKRQAIDALYPLLVGTAKQGLEVIDSLPKAGQEEPTEALPTPPPAPAAPPPPPGENRGLVPVA